MAQKQLSLWGERLSWKLNGDLTDVGERVVRIRGKHYLVPNYMRIDPDFEGRPLSQHDIEFTEGPHKGLRLQAQLLYQGEIEQDYKDLLPDNAICHTPINKECTQ